MLWRSHKQQKIESATKKNIERIKNEIEKI